MSSTQFTQKIHPGSQFPPMKAKLLSGEEIELGTPSKLADWRLVIVYRGRHCPLCTRYLNAAEEYVNKLAEIGVDIVAVSGDSAEQLSSHKEKLNVSFPLAYGLTVHQMQQLGTYISEPRSEQETDHPFSEPGLFVVNQQGRVQVIDISNNPFVRPELQALVNGLGWIRNPDNNYPIRGMREY